MAALCPHGRLALVRFPQEYPLAKKKFSDRPTEFLAEEATSNQKSSYRGPCVYTTYLSRLTTAGTGEKPLRQLGMLIRQSIEQIKTQFKLFDSDTENVARQLMRNLSAGKMSDSSILQERLEMLSEKVDSVVIVLDGLYRTLGFGLLT